MNERITVKSADDTSHRGYEQYGVKQVPDTFTPLQALQQLRWILAVLFLSFFSYYIISKARTTHELERHSSIVAVYFL